MTIEIDEPLEVLDEQGSPTGETKSRAAVHRDGDWHRAFHLWVVHDGGTVLLQRRAAGKDLGGGKVDVSVGGHLRAGETLIDVVREAEEEIGLSVRPGELTYLETLRSERDHGGGIVDRELQDVYVVAVPDRALAQYTPRCDEVSVLYEASLERAIALYRDGAPAAVSGWDCMHRTNNALLIEDDLIEPARRLTLASLERLAAWWAECGP